MDEESAKGNDKIINKCNQRIVEASEELLRNERREGIDQTKRKKEEQYDHVGRKWGKHEKGQER